MKKTLLIFLALALVGTFAFAEAMVGGEAAISGSVSLTAGYDLDNEGFGFVNDSDINITLPILSGDAGASGDGGVYAEILIENIGWTWDIDNQYDNAGTDLGTAYDTDNEANTLDADISATIHFNSLYLELGAPDFWINDVDISDDYSTDAYADIPGADAGFSLGFMNDMIDVAVQVASYGDYRTDAQDGDSGTTESGEANFGFDNHTDEVDSDSGYVANTDKNFGFGVMATLTPSDGISVPMHFVYDDLNKIMGFGAAPSVMMGAFTLDLPVDYVKVDTESGFEVQPAVAYTVMEGFDVNASFLYGSYTDVTGYNAALGAAPVNAIAEAVVGLADTEAFVPGLDWTLDVTFSNIMNYEDVATPDGYLPLAVDATASYMTGGMKPYVNTGYDFSDGTMDLNVGVEFDADFTGINNTVMTLDYDNGTILDTEAYTGDTSGNTDKGRVTFDITVSF